MARSYGQIMSAIWNDPDFRRLSALAQRAYLLLITQADISSAGTLALTVKRWGQYASDTPWDELSQSLSELADDRFVVLDFDTEEVVVRKFVKWDGGATNPKRRLAIVAAAQAVVSQRIRGVLAVELSKLGIEHGLCDALSDALSDRHPDTPRVVVTEVVTNHNPETTTHNPEPEPSAVADISIRPDVMRLCTLLADLIEANGSKRPLITKRWRDAARLMLDAEGRTEQNIATAIRWCQQDDFWRANILSMPKLREQYDRLRLAAQRVNPVAAPSTADARALAGAALGARLRAQEDRLELN